jgi:hypothetical protein
MGELTDNIEKFEFSVLCLVNLFSMLSVSSLMALSSGVRVVHYLSLCTTRTPLLKTMGELTDNTENKLTKHNTENSNNIQHEPHSLKPWVNALTTWQCCQCQFTLGFKQWGSCCTLFEFSVFCLVNG